MQRTVQPTVSTRNVKVTFPPGGGGDYKEGVRYLFVTSKHTLTKVRPVSNDYVRTRMGSCTWPHTDGVGGAPLMSACAPHSPFRWELALFSSCMRGASQFSMCSFNSSSDAGNVVTLCAYLMKPTRYASS